MKVWINVCAFNNERALDYSLHTLKRTTDLADIDFALTVFDPQYPLTTSEKLRAVCAKHQAEYRELPANRGQTGNFNEIFKWTLSEGAHEPDVVVMWDVDNNPMQRGWLKAAMRVCEADTRVGYVTPHRMPAWVLGNQGKQVRLGGVAGRHITWPGGFPMAIYSAKFLKDAVQMRQSCAFYGGTEGDALMTLSHCDSYGVMLSEFEDAGTQVAVDKEYVAWKVETMHLPSLEQRDFGDWLKAKGVPTLR